MRTAINSPDEFGRKFGKALIIIMLLVFCGPPKHIFVLLALSGLWILPFLAYRFSIRHSPHYKWTLTGICFGGVIAPASMGAYSLSIIGTQIPILGVLSLPVALVGLGLSQFHLQPPYQIAVSAGVFESGMEPSQLFLALVEGIFWGPIYGLAGWATDRTMKK